MRYLERILKGDRLMVTVPGRNTRKLVVVEYVMLKNKLQFRYDEMGSSAYNAPAVSSFQVKDTLANGEVGPYVFSIRPVTGPARPEILAIWRDGRRYDTLEELPRITSLADTSSKYDYTGATT